jgi:hypothetical protein
MHKQTFAVKFPQDNFWGIVVGFAIGKISFIAAIFGAVVMYANFYVRTAAAWYERREGPRDRFHLGALGFAVVFFVIGSVLQASYDDVASA